MRSQTNFKILLVDDDISVTTSIALLLKQNGFGAITASRPEEALAQLASHSVDLIIQDMNFSRNTSGEEGMELLEKIQTSFPGIPVVLMTAWGSIELAVNGIKAGAADFVTKPWDNQQLLRIINTCLDLQRPQQSVANRSELDAQNQFSDIVGEDPQIVEILSTIGRVAKTDASVLILGESGTGKEVIANAIHQNSKRSHKSMVKVNLGGMSTSLFESEMFGHVKGAFTDAFQDRQGRFELADGGTIFLDEIGDLDPASQVKLLRVLQDQSFQPLGSSKTKKVNVRVVAATNRDLYEMVKDGSFREDLLYRLNLITLNLPPLRKRRGDIPLLARKHLKNIEKNYHMEELEIDEQAERWLMGQSWSGNVRELNQSIERAVLMSGKQALDIAAFQNQLENQVNTNQSEEAIHETLTSSFVSENLTLEDMEKLMIEKALEAYQQNVSHVAKALGLSRAALYRRFEKYGIKP
ncbi:sigma-54 dependent transcriptional regulator [Aliikangiella sp. G2MR2-5]|uniref:sigma-54-dependent transcriptional regulator n=1 Tax=Aliikangiella sp. G2MR2-5 TaxID=2788943 RepID=UPI0018AC1F6A|nr:sigma-54 dependent transcriptional regulator [Aliikangiella sp. G2MR2-5]